MFKTESYTKGALTSILFNAIAKFVQFLNIFIIASFFGASTETDLYYFLYNFITVVVASFISTIDVFVLMPEFIRIRDSIGQKMASGFINKFLYAYLILGAVLSTIGFIFPVSIYSVLSNFDNNTLINNSTELTLSLILISLIIICNLLTSVLSTYKYFTIPNIVAFVNNSFSLIFLLLFYKKYGVASAIIGATFGYLFNTIFLVFLMVKKIKWNFFWVDRSFDVRIFKFIGATQITAFVVALRIYFTQYLLSGFGGGILTAINWGNQIGSVGEIFVNSQLYTVSGIKFSEFYTKDKKEDAVNFLYNVFSILLTLGCMMFVVLYTCNIEIATLMNFKNKFTTQVLTVLSLSIVFFNIIPNLNIITFLANKILAAFQHINFRVVRNSLYGQLFCLLFIWIGVKYAGYNGYFYGTVFGFLVIAFFNYKLINRYFKSFSFLTIIKKNVKTILITLLCIGILEVIYKLKILPTSLGAIGKILLATTLVCTIFFKKLKLDYQNIKNSIQ